MKLYDRFFLYPLAALLLLMQSCVGEALSGCDTNSVKVFFKYRTTYAQWLIDPAEVTSVNLLVFDENGVFVGEWIDQSPAMSASYFMEIPLPYGTYQFVCWAGMDNSYTITPHPLVANQTKMSDCVLSLDRTSQNTVTSAPHHLFHAIVQEGVVDNPECTFALELKKMTNTINVTTEGLESSTNNYLLTIDDSNGDYDFKAALASSTKLQYVSTCQKNEQGQPYGSVRTMTLSENRTTPLLSLTNITRSENAFSASLIELILKLRERAVTVDFNNIHTYNIHLQFDANMNVKVSVNGWELNASEAEL